MRLLLILPFVFLSCANFAPVTKGTHFFDAYSKEVVEGQTVHLLSIDLSRYEVRPIKASSLATTTELAEASKALAAINGGFFQEDGTPAGLLIIDRKVLGYQSKPRAALGWTKGGDIVLVDRFLYTKSQPQFASQTGSTTPEQWESVDYALGGTPLLVHENQMVENFDAEKVREPFLNLRHARSALCVRDEKQWIFVVVEGSSSLQATLPFLSRSGFTMAELAHFMANRLHCKAAINLDGGGSSALVIDGNLVNATTFGERPVSDALGVFERP